MKPGEVVTAAKVNEVIDRVNAYSNITVGPGLELRQGAGGRCLTVTLPKKGGFGPSRPWIKGKLFVRDPDTGNLKWYYDTTWDYNLYPGDADYRTHTRMSLDSGGNVYLLRYGQLVVSSYAYWQLLKIAPPTSERMFYEAADTDRPRCSVMLKDVRPNPYVYGKTILDMVLAGDESGIYMLENGFSASVSHIAKYSLYDFSLIWDVPLNRMITQTHTSLCSKPDGSVLVSTAHTAIPPPGGQWCYWIFDKNGMAAGGGPIYFTDGTVTQGGISGFNYIDENPPLGPGHFERVAYDNRLGDQMKRLIRNFDFGIPPPPPVMTKKEWRSGLQSESLAHDRRLIMSNAEDRVYVGGAAATGSVDHHLAFAIEWNKPPAPATLWSYIHSITGVTIQPMATYCMALDDTGLYLGLHSNTGDIRTVRDYRLLRKLSLVDGTEIPIPPNPYWVEPLDQNFHGTVGAMALTGLLDMKLKNGNLYYFTQPAMTGPGYTPP